MNDMAAQQVRRPEEQETATGDAAGGPEIQWLQDDDPSGENEFLRPSISQRFLAGAIDFGIALGLFVTLSVWARVFGVPVEYRIMTVVLAIVVSMTHHTLGYKLYGRTLGKAIYGLQVVNNQGDLPSFDAALTRSLAFHFQLFLFGLPLLLIPISANRQGFHCRLSRTEVLGR